LPDAPLKIARRTSCSRSLARATRGSSNSTRVAQSCRVTARCRGGGWRCGGTTTRAPGQAQRSWGRASIFALDGRCAVVASIGPHGGPRKFNTRRAVRRGGLAARGEVRDDHGRCARGRVARRVRGG
jgi:hypothetical protein